MVQADLPLPAAQARLRARAFRAGVPIAEVAAGVVAGRIRFAPDDI